MPFRSQFRDKQQWLKSTDGKLELNTASDVAVKEYDRAITQLLGWYDDENSAGLQGAVQRMVEADPEFVLGQALNLEIEMMGFLSSPRLDQDLAKRVSQFNELMKRKEDKLSEHEKLHCQVVNLLASNEMRQVARVLERIITLCPHDLAAAKMAQDVYFFLGTAMPMRNGLATCAAHLKSDNPLAGYVHGMFSFALEESNMYAQAEREALAALDLIPEDTWAIHNYAHCLEMQAKTKEGLQWMLDRQNDWVKCQHLTSHQYWHTALFHINNDNFDQAVDLLDSQIISGCSYSALDMHDVASMIYRMELVKLFDKKPQYKSAGNRWDRIYKMCKPKKHDHLVGFNDAHYMMSYLGMNDFTTAQELIDSLDENPNLIESKSVVKPLLEAMYKFKSGSYADCVKLLEPIRFDIIRIGGSHAQRDVFDQLLLVAALRSDKAVDNQLAHRMLSERDVFYGRRTTQTGLLAQAY